MIIHRQKLISLGVIFSALGLVAFCFQNYTTVDFTKMPEKSSPPTALEKAIQRSDREQLKGKKRLGVDDRQIQKKYLARPRKPSSIGDVPVAEVQKNQKDKRLKVREQRRKPTSGVQKSRLLGRPRTTPSSAPSSAR